MVSGPERLRGWEAWPGVGRRSGPGSKHLSGGPESHGEALCRPFLSLSTYGGSYAAEQGSQGLEARGLRPGRSDRPGRG